MQPDLDDLRDRIIAFDVRRGPYPRELHPLYDFKVWCEGQRGGSSSRADMYAARLRQILIRHTLPEILGALDPDDVIDGEIVRGQNTNSRGADRTTLRRTVHLIQDFSKEAWA